MNMRKRWWGVMVVAAVAATAHAGALEDYLAVRKQHNVAMPVSSEALSSFVGERVMEVKGLIKGSIGSRDNLTLMLQTPNGTINVKASNGPEWVMTPNTSARMLVRATRSGEMAPVRATLIAAMPEYQMSNWEEAERKRAELASQQAAQRAQGSQASRSGGRGDRMPGNIPALNQPLSAPLEGLLPAYVGFIKQRNSRLSTAKATEIASQILHYSERFGVDARLIMAIVVTESNFNPNAVSHAGARGLGQLMPGTARELGVNNVFDTDQNLYGTTKLITQHLSKYGKNNDDFEALVLSLAAYNAGPGAVSRHGGVPPYRETQNYVRKVVEMYRQLCGESGLN